MICVMKSERMTFVLVAAGLVAAAAAFANIRAGVDGSTLVGFGAAAALVLLVSMDYRLTWKRQSK